MGTQRIVLGFLVASILFITGCGGDEERKIDKPAVEAPAAPKVELVTTPDFNGDSAYAYVVKQVAFGPRVPNTPEHKACADWLISELERHGLEINVQEATVTAYNGKELEIYNIMGRYRPDAKERILLMAHWDTRPYADRDDERKNKPIDGANDGGSGVGVLLEIARVISEADIMGPNIGFDILFFDAEDYGKPSSSMTGDGSNTWCLGSQYWSQNIPIADYKPKYGILLDMVAATDAVFPKEGQSLRFAPQVVDNVWAIAKAMGHSDYFSPVQGNPLIDDHIYVNQFAKIPTIDIIHYEMLRYDFGTFHHTHDDNMDLIDKGTMKVVGDVVLQVIYQE